MINSTDFANRLKIIMGHHQLTASIFADKIGVQRSSISHILSGRNKPSLDFVMKIVNSFSDIDIYWLLNGVGNYPTLPSVKPNNEGKNQSRTLFPSNETQKKPIKRIERIVVFFSDGTFQEYDKKN